MNSTSYLESLGARLKEERLRKNDTQLMFAARIGVSIPTLKKMEDGNPSVQIGSWSTALRMLDRESDLDYLFAPPEDLFVKYNQASAPKRRRASRVQR
ncbi:MAG: helix-turn-helix domain-containing protein [Desulfuromonadales bacterium]|nr:helix-turn-helix domain-containing protein [Desulfuromonadales bacterium]